MTAGRIVFGAAASLLLAGCVGYGYPVGDGGHGGYGGHPGYGRPSSDGYYGGGRPAPDYGVASTVRCESKDNRTRHCPINTRGGVSMTRQLSRTRCEQGRNWGWDNAGVWVSQGCRAEFATGRGGGWSGGRPGVPEQAARTIRCESKDRRYRRCDVPVGRGVDVARQLSDTRCVQGRTWGWDRNGVWVDGGCRAEFRIR